MRSRKPLLAAACTAALLIRSRRVQATRRRRRTSRSPIPRVPTRCRRCVVRRWRTRSIWPMPLRRSRPVAARIRRHHAAQDRADHFAREADLIGFGGNIAANLRDAVDHRGRTPLTRVSPGCRERRTPAASSSFTEGSSADEASTSRTFRPR